MSGRQNRNIPLPPEQLSEFQKFVASTTGVVLPVYGAKLFRTAPSTFAPVEGVPVPADYVIGVGDEIRIRLWGQVNFQSSPRVDREGEIFIPQVGPIHVAGLSYAQLTSHLREAVGRNFKNFELSVDLGQIRSVQIYVSGQAQKPGLYTISALSTLTDAIFASGGPTLQGSLRSIELRRAGNTITSFDLYRLLIYGDKSGDVKLLPGDVIFIPPVGAQVAMLGSVRSPAIYELLKDETLGQTIGDAGGASNIASRSKVSVERIDAGGERHAMEVSYNEAGLGASLHSGDIVRVLSIVPEYKNTVTLRGNVANPGRFAWHAGMKVSDLIPDKDSLITRDYWWKRTQLGLPAPEFEPVPGFARMRQPVDDHAVILQPVRRPQVGPNGEVYTDSSQPGPTPYNGYGLPSDSVQAANSVAGVSQSEMGADGTQSRFNQAPVAGQRTSSTTLADQLTAPRLDLSGVQRTEIKALAPEIDWNYAVIERFDKNTLKTRLAPFDLGRLVLQHDASQDLDLQPGDVVTIFSDADIRVPRAQQTKLVRLEGEFVRAGVYTVEPGETLRQLVQRAGGLTPDAYLYGSEFLRTSVRLAQQARIDEYVKKLSQDIAHSNVAFIASATSQQDVASGTAAASSERELLESLRQLKATGRVVLPFASEERTLAAVPDLPLEDGDRFMVPPLVATVNVIGSVYNQNSFLIASGRSAGWYLQMAGGPDRNADSAHAFIVRANGEVISRDKSRELWNGAFRNMKLNPGDSIVVPEKTFKPSALRGVLEWSQLFSQLALGVAAIDVLR